MNASYKNMSIDGENIIDSKCIICGDKANGFNFNVLSCESCKAFFRRNASKDTQLKCIFEGNCDINEKNRKICRFCRLKKCFVNGMKKEWILSDEQRRVRKNIQINDKISKRAKTRQNKEIHLNKNCLYELSINGKEDSTQVLCCAPFQEIHTNGQNLSEESSSTDLFEVKSEKDKQICTDLTLVNTTVIRPITDYRNNLTEVEGNYLTELLNATNILKIPIGSVASEATTLSDALQVMFSARYNDIRRYVSMSKSLMAFKNICQHDRFSLLRPGGVEMFFMRNVTGYFNDNDKEYFIIPTDNEKSSTCLIDFDLFRKTKPYLYEANSDFYRKISREWDSDEIILDLLTAIVLFNPDRCRILEPHNIRFQRHIYEYLLQRYLLLKYRTESVAKAKYCRLLNTIECLHVLFAKNRQINMEENLIDIKSIRSLFDSLDI